jgi:hypothetical protein
MTPSQELPNIGMKPKANRLDDTNIQVFVGGRTPGFSVLTNEEAETLRNALTTALDERSDLQTTVTSKFYP